MFYHLDTGHRLKEGLTIELGENKNSVFGHYYNQRFRHYHVAEALRSGDLNASLERLDPATFREYALEFFRLHHPAAKDLKLPSRLCAFFATGSVEDAIRYAERNDYKKEIRVFQVHTEGVFRCLDMTWLDRQFPKKFNDDTIYYWYKYWIGERFEKDPHVAKGDPRPSLCESLVTRPITVGRRVA